VLEGAVPDLLVLDIRLPDLSGPYLAIRIHQRHPDLPVLFVSGWAESLNLASKLEALHWGFLQKPLTGDALTHAAWWLLAPPHDIGA
jgi:two-component system cell cycle sensor histidine kinase/response regulator CckA